ncbi:MAG: response regulator transcription factor [Fusobacteriota bacterium]
MNKKILLIDDEKDVSEVVEMLLTSEGYEVSVAYNGKEGIKKAKSKDLDLIILDIMMPGMDGIEVCERMRKDPELDEVPIVMFSAKLSSADKKVAFNVGADGFITKPFNSMGFISGIRTYLELGRM